MRRCALLSLVLLVPSLARAAEPTTRITGVIGGRAHTGELGKRYAFGYILGAEAGYQPAVLGAAWSILFGTFESTRADNPEETLTLLEMSFGMRLRFPLGSGEAHTFAFAGAGFDLLRTSTPIPPGDSRSYSGPGAGGGLEVDLGGEFIISLGARYSLIGGGPSGLTLLLGIGAGS